MVLPLLTRIDHVGIACRDLRKAIDLYRTTFGLGVISLEVNEEQGVREAMLAVGPGAPVPGAGYVQLLEPLGPDTPVGKFLARRGEGIHHVGYGVSDIGEALATVAGTGIRLIDERPRHGSMGASIAFLHPADLGGVLTELVQFHRIENSEGSAKPHKLRVVCLSPGESRTRMADTRRKKSVAFTSSQD